MTDIEAHPTANRLSAYAFGRLDESEMDEIEEHLSSCDSCCQWIRDRPEDSLVAKLRHRATAPPVTENESTDEPPAGFQVPSSFVLTSNAKAALHDQTTADPPADVPTIAGLPKDLSDHPRYRIVTALGTGGMGTVYQAEHRLMDRPVALKVIRGELLSNPALIERFRREVKSAARLGSHPNIVAAYDAEQSGETHMLVMEFIEGTDLGRLVDRRGPLPVGEACEYVRQAAQGLQHAFEDGMVHRDIKPQNLMRTTRGQVKILDFGLSRFASEVGSHAGVTAEGMILGSADYIAPEQIDDPHAADIRADIYSLGCTLFFLLAGRPPFPDRSLIQKLVAHREKTARPVTEIRADVPAELARLVERMMAKDPAQRFPTPDEVAHALAPFADFQAARTAALRLDDPTTGDTSATSAASPLFASKVGNQKSLQEGTCSGPRPRRPWVRIAAALTMLPIVAVWLALIVYRIQTETGELVIEKDDPSAAKPPQVAQGEPSPAHAISPRTQAILDTLEPSIPMNFSDATLNDILTYIKQATFNGKKATDPGLQIYVDPLVERALTSKVRLDVNDAPLRLTLSLLLDQAGLAYLVKDDVLFISSPQGIDRERHDTASPAVDATPRTKRALAKLEEPISISFEDRTPLDGVLTWIRHLTTNSRGEDGITIFSDPRALQEAGCSLSSTVSIHLDGVPLKTTLRLMLKQLGLVYIVKDGCVMISSTKGVRKH
jgi:serine/threonine protein kinase